MFIIWGTKTRKEKLGTVADFCPACHSVRAFTVTKYFRVSHIYFIPLGRGTRKATLRQCWECGSEYHCEEEDYDEFLSEEAAEEMSMSELIGRSNQYLEKRLQRQMRERADSGKRSTEVWDALPADDDAATS